MILLDYIPIIIFAIQKRIDMVIERTPNKFVILGQGINKWEELDVK
jgi:hypothetical protein